MYSPDSINLDFRPSADIFKLPSATFLLATVKGESRRAIINSATRADTLEQLEPWVFQPSIMGMERTRFERIHPENMGGEYLPNLRPNEVEIARISIRSTTGDVTSVYCKPSVRGFSYRVVDEYNGETISGKPTCSSKKPLSLGELLDFFLGAWNLEGVLDANNLDEADAQTFVTASSVYYNEFAYGIFLKIRQWRHDPAAQENGDSNEYC